nr:xylulose kinase-1 [Tanacetum cinerariifolium]
MKMEYWITNTDHNQWKIILNGNSKKSLGRDSKRGIIILPLVSFEEHVVVQRETKARTLLLQSLPEDHMADFHHLDDAREIWLAAKPDNDDVNLKFLKELPPSWSQVALTLKTKRGLEYLSFDNLYNKLSAASTNTKMVYSDQPSHSSLITYTSAHSASIMEDVLHSFVAENEPIQQLVYEDFEQEGRLTLTTRTLPGLVEGRYGL